MDWKFKSIRAVLLLLGSLGCTRRYASCNDKGAVIANGVTRSRCTGFWLSVVKLDRFKCGHTFLPLLVQCKRAFLSSLVLFVVLAIMDYSELIMFSLSLWG